MDEYIYAFDRRIERRCVHIVMNGYAISLVSGSRFPYKKE